MPSLCLSWLSTPGFPFLFFHQIVFVFMFSFGTSACFAFFILKAISITTTTLVKRRSNFMFFLVFISSNSHFQIQMRDRHRTMNSNTLKRPRQSFRSCKKQEILKTTSLVLYCSPTFVVVLMSVFKKSLCQI